MNKTIKDTAREEHQFLMKQVYKFSNYNNISDIGQLGNISILYNKIFSGHKSRAKLFYDALTIDSRSKLPEWLRDYFYPDAIFRTFSSWKRRGRVVKRGEKSFIKDKDGIALFMYSQTTIPDYVIQNRARWQLINAIYSANDDAPYSEKEYDDLKDSLKSWNGTVYNGWSNDDIDEAEWGDPWMQ